MSQSTPSAGIAFFGAARDLNKIITSALENVLKDMRKQGHLGLSTADFTALHLTLEAEGATSDPLQIAEMGQMNKAAFNRSLDNLAGEYVTLERDGKTITSATLTTTGRHLAEKYQAAINAKAIELLGSPAIVQSTEPLIR